MAIPALIWWRALFLNLALLVVLSQNSLRPQVALNVYWVSSPFKLNLEVIMCLCVSVLHRANCSDIVIPPSSSFVCELDT